MRNYPYRRAVVTKQQPQQRRRNLCVESLEIRLMLHGDEPTYELDEHVHAHLSIFVEGENVPIPTDIGVSAAGIVANPHTHGTDGVLHIHPLDGAPPEKFPNLDDFFTAWRTQSELTGNNSAATFSASELMGKLVDDDHIVRMFVNGEAIDEFEDYRPNNGDQIVLSYEHLPDAGAPLLRPLSNATLPAGQTLHLPLTTTDPDGDAISYEVTSSNAAVSAEIMTGDSTLELVVTGVDREGEPFTGRLVYRLFDTLAPKTVARIKELISLGFYDGLSFHRVIKDFVVQGGDPSGDGTGGSGIDFDDEYHPSLTFNGYGQLAMAKSSDDTNDSQFFTTDTNLSFNISAGGTPLPPRHLNFNHTIFGQLVDGFDTFHRMVTTPLDGSVPSSPLTIVSARIIANEQLGVVRVSAPRGFTGVAEISVEATDTSGNSDVRAFNVDVIAPTQNNNPYLGTVEDIHVVAGNSTSIMIPVTDIDGDQIEVGFNLSADGPDGASIDSLLDVVVTPEVVSPGGGVDGFATITITPSRDFAGEAEMFLFVNNVGVSASQSTADIQIVPITVTPATPTRVSLSAASDTGLSSRDLITALRNDPASRLTFVVEGVLDGADVTILVDGEPIGTGTASSGTVSITTDGTRSLLDGPHTLTARQTRDGLQSSETMPAILVTDTTPLVFTNPPPASGMVGATYVFDADVDAAQAGEVAFRLDAAPAGMSINSVTGVATWSPSSAQEGLNPVTIVATDRAGNESVQAFTIDTLPAVTTPPPTIPVIPAISFAAARLDFASPFVGLADRFADPIRPPVSANDLDDRIDPDAFDEAIIPIYGSGSLRLGSIQREAERESERDDFFRHENLRPRGVEEEDVDSERENDPRVSQRRSERARQPGDKPGQEQAELGAPNAIDEAVTQWDSPAPSPA